MTRSDDIRVNSVKESIELYQLANVL